MNSAAQITHIFWKEYRTQRSLWLAIVLLFLTGAGLSVLFLPELQRPDASALFFSGVMTVVFYMLASGSILYASEKEQKTDVFLRTLPANPWVVLGVKCAWVMLSSLIAFGIFSGAAFLLGKSSPIAGDDLQDWLKVIAYLFSCSLFATLLTRHVFSAIGLSATVLIGGFILGAYLESKGWTPPGDLMGFFTTITVLLLVTSLELNRRWFRESDWSWGRGIRFARAMSMRSALALPVESAGQNRLWRRHLWREGASACVWLSGVTALAMMCIYWLYDLHQPIEAKFVLFSVPFVLVPLLIGVATCRGDQSQQRHLFLGNLGDSASRVLLVKHVVWMSCGLILILFLTLFYWRDYGSIASLRAEELTGSLRFVPITSSLLSSARIEQLSVSLIPGIQFCTAVALLLYAVGHLSSQLIAQPILSLLSGIAGGVFVSCMVVYFYSLDVPLFVLTVAPASCLFGLSFLRGEDWLTGNRSRQSWKQFFLWSSLGVWTLISLMAAWRVFEIPWSTVIDSTGLMNLPTYYLSGCLVGFACVLFALLFVDWFRRNFSDSSGRPLFGASRWCTVGGVIGTFLVGHNLLLFCWLMGYSQHTTMLAAPLRLAVHNDILKQDETGVDLYDRADEEIVGNFPLPEDLGQKWQPYRNQTESLNRQTTYYGWNSWSDVTEEQQQWLEDNREILPLFFEADDNGYVDSRIVKSSVRGSSTEYESSPLNFLSRNQKLVLLVRLQALKLEHESQLDEAWTHHIAVVRYARRFADDNFPAARMQVLDWLTTVMFNGDLWRWQARKEQTPELLAQAASDLHRELTQMSPLADAYRREGGWFLQFGDSLSTIDMIAQEQLLAAMPWERERLRTLIVQSVSLRTHLAQKIDEGTVKKLPPNYGLVSDDREMYWFRDRLGNDGSDLEFLLVTHPGSGQEPELLLVSKEFGTSTTNFYDGTRPIVDAAVNYETTPLVMYAPQGTTVLRMIKQPLAADLQDELEFWISLDTWIADCFIYGYRAETGQFPTHLGALYQAKRTRELFTPLSDRLTVARDPSGSPHRAGVNAALSRHRTEFTPESTAYNYTWFHASKWPQPEYNFGETPDRKPSIPLQAPRPLEAQP